MVKTNKTLFLEKYNLPNQSYSLQEISKITEIPLKILQESYNRGIGAHTTNLESVRLNNFSKNPDTKKYPASKRLSKEQWAMARVYSMIMGKRADPDLQEKVHHRKRAAK